MSTIESQHGGSNPPLTAYLTQNVYLIKFEKKIMSRIETLKKQFPHLTISLFDVLIEIDGTKTHKYSQLLCKLFDGYLKSESDRYKEELDSEVHSVLNHLSVPLDKDFNTNFM